MNVKMLIKTNNDQNFKKNRKNTIKKLCKNYNRIDTHFISF